MCHPHLQNRVDGGVELHHRHHRTRTGLRGEGLGVEIETARAIYRRDDGIGARTVHKRPVAGSGDLRDGPRLPRARTEVLLIVRTGGLHDERGTHRIVEVVVVPRRPDDKGQVHRPVHRYGDVVGHHLG